FTLIELLIVIAIIAIVAVVVFVTINPLERFRDARNSRRAVDLESIVGAVRMYQIENKGLVPTGLDENWKMIGTATSGCNVDCGGEGESQTGSVSFEDSGQTAFDSGDYLNTEYNSIYNYLGLSAGTSGSYLSSIKDGGSDSTFWLNFGWLPNNTVSTDGLITWLGFENGEINSNTITDKSGLGNNPVMSNKNSISFSSGKNGRAINFLPATNNLPYLTIPATTPSMQNFMQDGNFSFLVWFKLDSYPSAAFIISNFRGGVPGSGAYLAIFNNKFTIMTRNEPADPSKCSGTVTSGCRVTVLTFPSGMSGLATGQWYHAVATKSWNGSKATTTLYLNGNKINQEVTNNKVIANGVPVVINHSATYHFDGMLDETLIYNRAISASEVADQYRRGVARIKMQARACSESNCADNPDFIGPDDTASTYFENQDNIGNFNPSFSLENLFSKQYFQYKTYFETENSQFSPQLSRVFLEGNSIFTSSTFNLQSTCLDLSSTLGGKLNPIPQDPSLGSPEKTFYVINRDDIGKINAQACGGEGAIITTGR
ncbi:MAG TPA: hypothetical protein DEB09_04685, partial [Candidatus Magasanikbacteria bacterium]|nr:hypothetical protein [Candidatus Magasanikbacteria bacterium]